MRSAAEQTISNDAVIGHVQQEGHSEFRKKHTGRQRRPTYSFCWILRGVLKSCASTTISLEIVSSAALGTKVYLCGEMPSLGTVANLFAKNPKRFSEKSSS